MYQGDISSEVFKLAFTVKKGFKELWSKKPEQSDDQLVSIVDHPVQSKQNESKEFFSENSMESRKVTETKPQILEHQMLPASSALFKGSPGHGKFNSTNYAVGPLPLWYHACLFHSYRIFNRSHKCLLYFHWFFPWSFVFSRSPATCSITITLR